jgi:hypothetical protein
MPVDCEPCPGNTKANEDMRLLWTVDTRIVPAAGTPTRDLVARLHGWAATPMLDVT